MLFIKLTVKRQKERRDVSIHLQKGVKNSNAEYFYLFKKFSHETIAMLIHYFQNEHHVASVKYWKVHDKNVR